MKKYVSLLALTALFQLSVSHALAAGTLYGVGDLPGGAIFSEVRAATREPGTGAIIAVGGSVANEGSVGSDTAVVWTSTGGLTAIPNLVANPTGTTPIIASAITPNGAYIASRSRSVASGGNRHAVRVTRSDLSSLDLGFLDTFTQFSVANTISSDGSVLYGFARYEAGGKSKAVRFTAAGPTITPIPFLNVGDDSSAPAGRAASFNGNVMIGTSTNTAVDGVDFYGPGNTAFRYVQGAGVSAIPLLPGGTWSLALALTPDGNRALVVGGSTTAPEGEAYIRNFALSQTIRLGTPNGSWRATNLGGISADGSVVALTWGDENPRFPGIYNAAGWHDLTDLATRAGINLTGWSIRNITGMSPDATLVWGTGTHNGNTEGWVLDFPAGYLAMAEEPVPASSPGSAIVGTWTLGDPATNDSTVLIFSADGYYAHMQVAPEGEHPGEATGFERGQFSWNAETGAFWFKTLLDTNGDTGLSGDSGATNWTVTVSGNTMTVNIPDEEEGPVQLTRLVETGQPTIVGTWGSIDDGNDSFAVVFLPGGVYYMFEDGNTDPATDGDPSGQDGLERGTYTWNPVNGAFTATPNADENGQWGLSHPDSETTTITFSADGNTLYVNGEVATRRMGAAEPAAPGDFNGDGKGDIIWQNSSTGDRSMWLMNGTQVAGGTALGNVPVAWTISGKGDFNGDGSSDLLWTNTVTGDRAVWLMNGSTVVDNAFLGTIPVSWSMAGCGDFDGDGKTDIFWSNTATGDCAIWIMNGGAPSGGGYITTLAPAWQVRGIDDFNDDGKADVLWSNTSTGERAMWLMSGITATAGASLGTLPLEWQFSATADFNGDNMSDIVLTNTTTGDRAMWLMNGTSIANNQFLGTVPPSWVMAATDDYDGDGRADIFWSSTATGDCAIWIMHGSTVAGGGFLTTLDTNWHPVP